MNTQKLMDFMAGGWRNELGTQEEFKRNQEIREKENSAAEINLANEITTAELLFRERL